MRVFSLTLEHRKVGQEGKNRKKNFLDGRDEKGEEKIEEKMEGR